MVRVGSYLDETMIPVMALLDNNCTVALATPQGTGPIMDSNSNKSDNFASEEEYKRALHLWYHLPAFSHSWDSEILDLDPLSDHERALHPWHHLHTFTRPLKVSELASPYPDGSIDEVSPKLDQFDALFIPGGHAPIVDIWPSPAVGRIIYHFHSRSKIVAAICHGTIALASVSLFEDKKWPFKGKEMTVFSKGAEKQVEKMWGHKLGFYPEEVLKDLGAKLKQAKPFAPNLIIDSSANLITGQNPASATLLAEALVETLKK